MCTVGKRARQSMARERRCAPARWLTRTHARMTAGVPLRAQGISRGEFYLSTGLDGWALKSATVGMAAQVRR